MNDCGITLLSLELYNYIRCITETRRNHHMYVASDKVVCLFQIKSLKGESRLKKRARPSLDLRNLQD